VKKACSVFFLSFFFSASYAQNVSTVNGEPISCREFMWAYKKSHNGNNKANYDELLAYLKLYINFKLKVNDARELGLDKNENYKEEIKAYESALKAHNKVNKYKTDTNFLLNEYKEGVLMFNVSEQKVWLKAQEDEQALNNFYINKKTNYDKPLNDIRGQVVADYQQSLEEEWLSSLKKKYNVKINENELIKLAKP
jgi:Rad3-related DNA helicase